MADWLERPHEIVALLVAFILALGFLTLLGYARAMDSGLSRQRASSLLLQLWAAAGVALLALIAARVALGHALLSGTPTTDWDVAPVGSTQIIILVVAGLVVVACLVWIRRTVTRLSHGIPGTFHPPGTGTP